MTQEEIIKKVVDMLDKNGIPYMLAGAIAVNYYGRPRLTHDVDLVIQLQLKDAERVAHLFEGEFYIALEGIIDAVEHGTMFNLIHSETGIKVDCWILKHKEYDKLSFARKRKETIFDQEMYISSPEDLVIAKLDWYKQSDTKKHYDDVVGIFQIQQGKLDIDYIRKWANRLSFSDILEDILNSAMS